MDIGRFRGQSNTVAITADGAGKLPDGTAVLGAVLKQTQRAKHRLAAAKHGRFEHLVPKPPHIPVMSEDRGSLQRRCVAAEEIGETGKHCQVLTGSTSI